MVNSTAGIVGISPSNTLGAANNKYRINNAMIPRNTNLGDWGKSLVFSELRGMEIAHVKIKITKRNVGVLLDPINPSDCKLLTFDTSNGKPIPRFSKEDDEWKNYRAEESINYYHLDEGTWNYKRKDLMDEVSILCDKLIESEQEGGNSDPLIDELVQFLEPHAEFITAAEQVIREKGLLELVA